MSSSRSPRGAVVALVLAAASWGFGTVVSKRAVEEIAPFTLLVIQLGASLIALTILLRLQREDAGARPVPPLLARLGILNPGIAYALSLIGLTQIDASLSVLLWAAEPILILALAAVVLGERVGPSFVLLSATAAVGMLLVLFEPGTGGSWFGIALTLAGVACCAVYTVLTRKWLGEVEETAPVVVAQQAHAFVVAAVAAVVVVALSGGATLPLGISGVAWLSALGSGLLYYGAAYLAYLAALRVLPASTASSSFYLIPVFGIASAAILLGERLTAVQWFGTVLVIGAVAVILRVTDPARQPHLTEGAPT